MPKMVSEIPLGREFVFTGKPGETAATTKRTFRIIKNDVNESIDPPSLCQVYVGDPYPGFSILRCTNYDVRFDGDSRMVVIATFSYEILGPSSGQDGAQQNNPGVSSPGGGGGGSGGGGDAGGGGGGDDGGRLSSPPDVRPANWSVSSSIMEVPAYTWQEVLDAQGSTSDSEPAANPVGDMYEGITRLEPVVTINVEQFEFVDPTRHVLHIGKTNLNPIKLGTLDCPRRTVMLRSVQSRAATEQFGPFTYRGWNVTYEFAFRRNHMKALRFGISDGQEADVGWDIAVPLTGMNVKAFNPGGGDGGDENSYEVYGQPLKHKNYKVDTNPLALPDGVAVGDKVRGMVKVHEYEDGGVSQAPCAQPIPLNPDGSPRSSSADPKVIIRRYKVTEEIDFASVLALRLT